MKRKLLAIFALFASLASLAQEDVTSKYIKNPSFETNGTSNWIASNLQTQTNNSFEKKAGNTYLEKWVAGGNAAGNASIKQVIKNLPAGSYTLVVAAQNYDQNNKTAKKTGMNVYAGTKKTTVYTPDDYSVEFSHIHGEIEIGMTASNAQGNWICVDNFRLYRNGGAAITDAKKGLENIISECIKRYGDGTGVEAEAFNQEIENAKAIYENEASTADELTDAINDLYAALDKYNRKNVSEEYPLDCTEYIKNPSFEVNGTANWTVSNLVSQSNSSFTKKEGGIYLEKWTSAGNQIGDGKVSQVIELPNGEYKLVVAAQNYSQNATTKKNEGAYIYAGDAREIVYTPADYSVKFKSIAGKIEIGFEAIGATGNWLSVDNFRLYLIGEVDKAGVVAELTALIEEATNIYSQETPTDTKALETLLQSINSAKAIDTNSSDKEIADAANSIKAALEAVNASRVEHRAVADAIYRVSSTYDESKEGAAEFKAVLDKANELYIDGNATSEQLAAIIVELDKAALAFNLANATPGTGTAPKVSDVNKYVATGATEALMRATMSGSNIIEKGVCWSTEHNPTVLDNRTTKSFTLNGTIFHVKGLEPATVYYLRPYAMNKTYTVAYGEEIKIVTHPKGTCRGTWNEGAPTPEANTRCRNAINETITYFNEWTGIKGFTLSGNYGAGTPTADCSYGGWMRIGPNAGNQAIGTVIHETGHGVGVGTSSRWADKNVHDWVWKGREANDVYHFLENKCTSEYTMVGDGTHGWGQNASYDWFVNGADKDKHLELQYIGGCCLLYGLFIDGLCPTSGYSNGISGYTYNFDDSKKYYIMNKDKERGLGTGLLYQVSATAIGWNPILESAEELTDSAAWYMEYDPQNSLYMFRNAATGKYMTHAANGTNVTLKSIKEGTAPAATEKFQLMPDRTDVTIKSSAGNKTTHGYWFTWNSSGNKAMGSGTPTIVRKYGAITQTAFDYADTATQQQWIIISEDEIEDYHKMAMATDIQTIKLDETNNFGENTIVGIYSTSGNLMQNTQKGINIIKYSDGTSKKIFVK